MEFRVEFYETRTGDVVVNVRVVPKASGNAVKGILGDALKIRIQAPPVEGKANAAQVHAFSEEIMYRLSAMLPPKYRGVYSDLPEQRPDLLALYAPANEPSH